MYLEIWCSVLRLKLNEDFLARISYCVYNIFIRKILDFFGIILAMEIEFNNKLKVWHINLSM
jgi:hypothetical protein